MTKLPEGADTAILPHPSGYKVLIAMPKSEEKKGNIYIPEKVRQAEDTASIYGCVVKLGPAAYKDTDKFPFGAYCEEGDWVIFKSYTGTRFKVEGVEYRLINDDSVEAVVDDPRKVERA